MFKVFASAIFLSLFIVFSAQAQLQFDASFENGRLDTVYQDSGTYVLSPITNIHFRITNATGSNPEFKVFDSVGFQLRSYHYMVYRYGGDTNWQFFDTGYKQGSQDYYHFLNFNAFQQDTVFIAYWFPYTYTDLEQYILEIEGSPFVQHAEAKTTSYQGRNIYGYQLSDTSWSDCHKHHVVITARQHPIENINGYFIEGFTDYLIQSNDSIAAQLRRNYIFYIYPMLNPDGVYNGSGQNALGQGLNREWADSLIPGGTPEIDSIRPVIWAETNHQVEWSMDIHANPGSNIPYYYWGYTVSSPVPTWQISLSGDYVQAVAQHDQLTSSIGLFSSFVQGSGVNSSNTAANWFTNSFSSIAYTFEPTSEPLGYTGDNRISIARMQNAGAALAKGYADVFYGTPALGGQIALQSNQLVASVQGGIPPYSYSWSGPVSGTTDTLNNIVDGTYQLLITDDDSCQWSDSITVTLSPIHVSPGSTTKVEFRPNPASNIVYVKFPVEYAELHFSIMSLSGQYIRSGILVKDRSIDLSDIKPGLYLIESSAKGKLPLYSKLIVH